MFKVEAIGFEQAAERMRPLAHVRYVQLERGVAHVEGAIARLENIVIGRTCGDRNKMEHHDLAPGRLTVIVPMQGSAYLSTSSLRLDDVVVIGAGKRIVVFADRSFLPVWISASIPKCRELAADLQMSPRLLQHETSLRRVPTAQALALDRWTLGLFGTLTAEPDAARRASRMKAAEEEILRWCVVLLAGGHTHARPDFGAAARRRAVLRAREFIDANLDQPLSLPLLCRMSFASARALEYGFREMYGVSPMTYARYARLSRVRGDLYASEPLPRLVTDLATKWGFLHLSQFSKDYRVLFGESPSETGRAQFR